jgi:hypothetical protein
MRTHLTLLALAVGLAILPSGESAAAVSGPFCWTIPPFTDLLALTFITDGGNTAAVTGRNVFTNTAVSGAAFRESDGVTINMVVTIGQASLAASTFHVQARFSSATGAGSGRCQAVNLGSGGGCGPGTNITLMPAACPVGALEADARPPGPRAGGDD